jgi:hypothetical protein
MRGPADNNAAGGIQAEEAVGALEMAVVLLRRTAAAAAAAAGVGLVLGSRAVVHPRVGSMRGGEGVPQKVAAGKEGHALHSPLWSPALIKVLCARLTV